MLADIIVKDEYAIQLIEEGLRQVSCGYDAEYEQTTPAQPRWTSQVTMWLFFQKAEPEIVAIGDRTMATQKKSWLQRLRFAHKTGDADTMNELLDSAPAAVTVDEGDLPSGVNLNINLSPQQLPERSGDGRRAYWRRRGRYQNLAQSSAGETGRTTTGDNADDPKVKEKMSLPATAGRRRRNHDYRRFCLPCGSHRSVSTLAAR